MPVVAYRASGIVEVVEHGVGGLLSPPGDVSAIAAATASLLTDATRRRAMGHAGPSSSPNPNLKSNPNFNQPDPNPSQARYGPC